MAYIQRTGNNQPVSYIKSVDSTRKIYIQINDAYKNIGTLKISTTIETASANIINLGFIDPTSITFNSTINLENDLILSTPDLSLYKNPDGYIVFDAGSNRIKAKTTATGYENEVFITGDTTYGVSTEKVKENISDASYPDITNFLRNTEIKQFNYKEEYDPEKREDISFIIEELPEGYIKDILVDYAENDNQLSKYNLNTFVMLLAGALKEEISRNDVVIRAYDNLYSKHEMLEFKVRNLETVVDILLKDKFK